MREGWRTGWSTVQGQMKTDAEGYLHNISKEDLKHRHDIKKVRTEILNDTMETTALVAESILSSC